MKSQQSESLIRVKLKQYLDYKGISGYKFEKSIGKPKGWWGSCKNPTAENLSVMLSTYPDLSADWLLRGEGEMIRTKFSANEVTIDLSNGKSQVVGNNNVLGNISGTNIIGASSAEVEALKARIAELEEDKRLLQMTLKKLL